MNFCTKLLTGLLITSSMSLMAAEQTAPKKQKSVFDDWISPVSNPVEFESPLHSTSLRAIYLHQKVHNKLKTNSGAKLKIGGEINLAALQARWAVNDRFSIIASKDGYGKGQFDNVLQDREDFANLGIGFKWSPYLDEESQSILTLGLRFDIPIQSSDIYQENKGKANVFISYGKGFDDLHFMVYNGINIPFSDNNSTTRNNFSIHADYKIGNFYPLIELNWTHILRSAHGHSADLQLQAGGSAPVNAVQSGLFGNDLFEFGGTDTQGKNFIDVALGFRYRLTDNMDFGFVWQAPLSDDDDGIMDERYTFDLIYRF